MSRTDTALRVIRAWPDRGVAGIMGTSIAMIERHYGTLVEGAADGIARGLSAFGVGRRGAAEWG